MENKRDEIILDNLEEAKLYMKAKKYKEALNIIEKARDRLVAKIVGLSK